jgi:hypothetical protein
VNAALEIENGIVSIRFLNKALKEERLFHSRVIAGQADGTLIYFDSSGHIHVVHGTGPQAAQVEAEIKGAISQISQGISVLHTLATRSA